MQNKILDASASTVREVGLTRWTIDEVARRAGCAKGLVLYHHGSKKKLLEATAASVAANHHAARLEAIRGRSGAAALDSLWATLVDEVRTGWFRAWLALVAWSPAPAGNLPAEPENEALLLALGRSLTLPADRLPEPEALAALLDGVQVRLLQGDGEAQVLAAYERLWLGLLST